MKYFLILLTSFFSIITVQAVDIDNFNLVEEFYWEFNADTLVGDFGGIDNQGSNMKIEDGFKTTIYSWVKNIGGMLGLFAVAMIAYGGLMLTISTGDDEKIKKGKDIVKWGILGFLALVSAGAIITIVINIVFKLGGT